MASRSTTSTLRRTIRESKDDNITDWAAALTYYGVLSIFPALLALVSVVGLIGTSSTASLQKNLGSFAPGAAHDILSKAISNLSHNRSGAGLVFVIGLLVALWSASGYIAAFMRAANTVWDVEEGRPIWKTVPIRLGVTLLVVVLLALSSVAVVFTGAMARNLGSLLGVSRTAVTVWDIAKWPVLVLIVAGIVALLYYASPNVRHDKVRHLVPGAVVAVVLWLIASGAFALYVANFGSYNKTYGTLAAVVVFLVWLWISNIAILFGAELNAEMARGRRIADGFPDDREPFLEPRDTRRMAQR
jgi:membrane protein